MKIEFYNNTPNGDEFLVETWTDYEMHMIPQNGDIVALKDSDHKDVFYKVVSRIIYRTLMKVYVCCPYDFSLNPAKCM